MQVAITTFAIMKAPYGEELVRGFEDLTPDVFLSAENAPGFVERAKEVDEKIHLTNFERDWGKWGKFTVPRFYDGGFDTATDTRASTLSLWSNFELLKRFVYRGLHSKALASRQNWFRQGDWPTYAIWWVAGSAGPTWSDAVNRLEHLHDKGPSPYAFTFHSAFLPSGDILETSSVR